MSHVRANIEIVIVLKFLKGNAKALDLARVMDAREYCVIQVAGVELCPIVGNRTALGHTDVEGVSNIRDLTSEVSDPIEVVDIIVVSKVVRHLMHVSIECRSKEGMVGIFSTQHTKEIWSRGAVNLELR